MKCNCRTFNFERICRLESWQNAKPKHGFTQGQIEAAIRTLMPMCRKQQLSSAASNGGAGNV